MSKLPKARKELKEKVLNKDFNVSVIYLKTLSDKYQAYSVAELCRMYRKYKDKCRNLHVFASDSFITLESAEILIKTAREYFKS